MKNNKKQNNPYIRIICAALAVVVVVAALGGYYSLGVLGKNHKSYYRDSSRVLANADGSGVTVIDDNCPYQTISGFGTSFGDWARQVDSPLLRSDAIKTLFDPLGTIRLNTIRYRLGAGSGNDPALDYNGSECFLCNDGTYDFSADANARGCLDTAVSFNKFVRIELYCSSPPYFLNKNNLTYPTSTEDKQIECNLSKENFRLFADFCSACSSQLSSGDNRLVSLSPIGEASENESCSYSAKEALSLYGNTLSSLDGVNSGASLALSLPADNYKEYLDTLLGRGIGNAFANKALRRQVSTINIDTSVMTTESKCELADYISRKYSGYTYSVVGYKPLGTDDSDLAEGITMAKAIVEDLTLLNASEWCYGTGASYNEDTSGLVRIIRGDGDDFRLELTEKYYCLSNFSSFIDALAVRIACSDGLEGIDSAAFVNRDNSTVIVYVNSTDKAQSTTLEADGAYELYTTDATHKLDKTAEGEAGNVEIALPAQSVVTFVMK